MHHWCMHVFLFDVYHIARASIKILILGGGMLRFNTRGTIARQWANQCYAP